MNDQAQPKPGQATVERTFFTVEVVHGASPALNELACTIVRLGVESSISMARVQLHGRKNAPEIFLRFDGSVQP